MLNLIPFGDCPTCSASIMFPVFASPDAAPEPVKLCSCKPQGRRTKFEREVRASYALADVEGDDATEVMLVLGTVFGRAQAAILKGDKVKLRAQLVKLTALCWKLGDEL